MSLPTHPSAFVALTAEHPFLVALDEAFGFAPGTFDGLTFWHRADSDVVWVSRWAQAGIRRVGTGALGIMANKRVAQPTRLSHGFIQRFGHAATRGRITLDIEATRAFAAGRRQPWPATAEARHHVIVVGTIALRDGTVQEVVLGRGRFEHGELCSDIPKANRFDVDM